MIKDKNIKIIITNYNRRFYKEYLSSNDEEYIVINQLNLSDRSTVEVECECDLCGKTHYIQRRNISTEKTYCSRECNSKSRKNIHKENRMNRKEELKNIFVKRIEEGKGITYPELKNDDPSLIWKSEKLFGNLSNLLSEIGIEKDELIKDYGFSYNIDKRNLNYEEIKERLLELKSKGKLNTSLSRKYFPDGQRLERSMIAMFGSFEDCLIHFNLERDLTNPDLLIRSGIQFEKTFKDSLDAINVNYEYQNRTFKDEKLFIPDFILDNDIWVDTKLSSWTDSIDSTISSYSTMCNKLIIVYLRGTDNFKSNHSNVEFIKVDKIFPHLVNVGREDLINEFNQIKSNIKRND